MDQHVTLISTLGLKYFFPKLSDIHMHDILLSSITANVAFSFISREYPVISRTNLLQEHMHEEYCSIVLQKYYR
jgi:hypothetical protein